VADAVQSIVKTGLGQERPFEQFDRTAGLSAFLPTCLAKVNACFGSNCDLRHRSALRLECDGEPTFSTERRLNTGKRT
jgi:hypothetical protein